MQFLAPAALAGLAALSLPVIIHLLNKFRVREVRWAATRFLLAAAQKNQRRVKMQDLLLLILRCLVLAFVVFAFARPTFEKIDKSDLVAGDPLTVMVLLDQSASMGASDGVQTRFSAARDAALDFLEQLPSGSAAGLLLVNDHYSSPVSRPSRDLSLVRRSVELARLTDRGTDFQPAVRAAVEALRNLPGRREIHLFTDNQLSGWNALQPVREVLVVESRKGRAPWQGTGHFLAAALAPVDEEAASRHYLHVTRSTAADLDPARFSSYSVIFLAAADPLPPTVVSALAGFIQNGGGLVVMPGDATPADLYLDSPWPDLLPARVNPPVEPARGSVQDGPYNHPLLTLWNGPAAGNLAALRFSRAFVLDPVRDPSVSVVLRLADDSPVILERTVGKGRVALFAAPPVPAWTNLPLHPAFVPLVHRLYAGAARSSTLKLNLAPGDTFQAPVPIDQLNRDVYLRGPEADAKLVAVGRTELVGTQAVLRVRDTSAAGRYVVYVGQTERPDLVFAVQSPAAESDLRAAPADILATSPASDSQPSTLSSQLSPPLLTAHQLWMTALAAAALLSCAELLLALRTSRSR